MKIKDKKIIIISASSDIGRAMCLSWQEKGAKIFGTYRTDSISVRKLKNLGIKLFVCDLQYESKIKKTCSNLKSACPKWDVLVLCPGTQEPIGPFTDTDFKAWENSIKVNFLSQLNIIHNLLPYRNKNNAFGPCVLFFAGGGTNNATLNYSAYTVSKIALIKMCELLDAEIKDTRFAIVGPGWVKTKIHKETLKAKKRAGGNYKRVKDKFSSGAFTPMEDILDCCEWLINSPRKVIGGRNFSVIFDMWGKKELSNKLIADQNMYKLRRCGNELLIRKGNNND